MARPIEESIERKLRSEEGRQCLAETLERMYTLTFCKIEKALKRRAKGTFFMDWARGRCYNMLYARYQDSVRVNVSNRQVCSQDAIEISLLPEVKKGELQDLEVRFRDEYQQTFWNLVPVPFQPMKTASKLIDAYGKVKKKQWDVWGCAAFRISDMMQIASYLLDSYSGCRQNFWIGDTVESLDSKFMENTNPSWFYLDDPAKFKIVMPKLNDDQRRQVIEKVFNYDKNEELDVWLSEQYPGLVREVGRDRVYL